jgi:hypothetical protein
MPQPLSPQGKTLVPIEHEARWVPEQVQTFWRRKKSLSPAGIRTLDHPAHSQST